MKSLQKYTVAGRVLSTAGFVGLLRSGEIVWVTCRDFAFHGNLSVAVITLEDTKGAKRHGGLERVLVYDPLIVKLLHAVVHKLKPQDKLYPYKWAGLKNDIVRLAAFFGVKDESLS